MKKNLKLLVIGLLVAVAATLTCAFMPACGDGATSYSVKVVCAEEGFDYTQLTVQWCSESGCHGKGGRPIALNAKGEATCEDDLDELAKDETLYANGWHVQLNKVPAGYTYTDNYYTNAPGTVTITLTKTN